MSKKKNGGPAFPAQPTQHVAPGVTIEAHNGMTLRDYFAAKFMNGWMASWNGPNPNDEGLRLTAETAYAMADAMIRARDA